MKQNFKKGFTLIELLVVIAIIGILAAITVVSVQSPRNRATDTKTLSDLRSVASLLEQRYTDTNDYPTQAVWTAAGLGNDLTAYGAPLPVPNGVSVIYHVNSATAGYCVWANELTDATKFTACKTGGICVRNVSAPAAGTWDATHCPT